MKKTVVVSLLAVIVLSPVFFGFGCKQAPSPEVTKVSKPITLSVWRVFDTDDTMAGIISAYEAQYPNVNIEYRVFRYEDYADELINAFAEDRGPDVFSLPASWVRAYQAKISPMPASVRVGVQTVKQGITKEVVWSSATVPLPTLAQVERDFAPAVPEDVIIADPADGKSKVYGLPLALDTLALYYNKSMLDAAGIPEPARTWDQVQQTVNTLTKVDVKGFITQSAIALGAIANIDRAADILALLVGQNGGSVMKSRGDVTLGAIPRELADKIKEPPAFGAVKFYMDFATPSTAYYTWNSTMPQALEAFAQGKVAYFLGYSYHAPVIRARAPQLKFGIAPVPQIEGNSPVNMANYWVETVSRKSAHQDHAWNFIRYATSADGVKPYLAATGKPTALRSLIKSQLTQSPVDVFAGQVLTARSWYWGKDSATAEKALTGIVDDLFLLAEPQNAFRNAITKIQQTVR